MALLKSLTMTLMHSRDAFYAFYKSDTLRQSQDAGTNIRIFGSLSAVTLGIIFFVGGLTGWLLVMKKRVLQCNVCGAVALRRVTPGPGFGQAEPKHPYSISDTCRG